GGSWSADACSCGAAAWDAVAWDCVDETECVNGGGHWTGSSCDCAMSHGPGGFWDGSGCLVDGAVEDCVQGGGTWYPGAPPNRDVPSGACAHCDCGPGTLFVKDGWSGGKACMNQGVIECGLGGNWWDFDHFSWDCGPGLAWNGSQCVVPP